MMKDLISIVLTSHNGHNYIKDQIDSIVRQTWKSWELIVVDNNSKDDTLYIVRTSHPKLLHKNIFIYKNVRNLGLARSFQNGLKHAHGSYIAVCNQDDVWLPQKLETQYKEIKKQKCGLVYTDMKVVDSRLKPLSPSYRHEFLSFLSNASHDTFEELLHENHIAAPTILFDSRYKNYLFPFSRYGYEDNWIVLHVAMRATIGYIDKPTMLYRQHESNLQGAGRFTFFSLFRRNGLFLDQQIAKKQKYIAFLKDLASSPSLSYYYKFLISQKIYNIEVLLEVLNTIHKRTFGNVLTIFVKLLKTSGKREAQQIMYFYLLTKFYKRERTS